MTDSSDVPVVGPSTDDFARQLRQKAEEAVSASIHHASLSQQYLALSQKYTALAEQAVNGQRGTALERAIATVDRECLDGIPGPPLGIPQKPPPAAAAVPAASGMSRKKSTAVEPQTAKNVPDTRSDASPPIVSSVPKSSDSGSPKPPVTVPDSANTSSRSRGPRSRRQARRRRIVVRDLVRQLHTRMPMLKQKVRIRARRSDLKPKQRTATEELKQSRRPAAVSAVVFALLVAILASLRLTFAIDPPIQPIVASFTPEQNSVEEALPIEPPEEQIGEQTEAEVEEPVEEPDEEPPPEADAPAESQEMAEEEPSETPPVTDQPSMQAASDSSEATAQPVDGRTADGRQLMLKKYGGSAASESAVHSALVWLASVQRPDGSWDFSDIGASSRPGTVVNPIGGTAYALLPFLAAGQTHQEGEFRVSVRAGLDYLMRTGINVPAGFDLRGVLNKGNEDDEPNEAYYVHGAATLALCEALWMSGDRRLKPSADGAVHFLLNSQDPRGGGWRYLPQQPGSTSVTAMQVMALKSAEKAGIKIPASTWQGIMHYLDSVQVDGSGRYGYEIEKKSYQASLTAMALLSRMYLGWERNDGDLRDGIGLLDKRGPYDNLYYNYFATQVMRHWGGEEWTRWNERLRDDLVRWQVTEGPEQGSWTPRDRADYSVAGGRLLTTCLATLTLEVYYRYEPLLSDPGEEATTVVASD